MISFKFYLHVIWITFTCTQSVCILEYRSLCTEPAACLKRDFCKLTRARIEKSICMDLRESSMRTQDPGRLVTRDESTEILNHTSGTGQSLGRFQLKNFGSCELFREIAPGARDSDKDVTVVLHKQDRSGKWYLDYSVDQLVLHD